jgi:hypothetical protein
LNDLVLVAIGGVSFGLISVAGACLRDWYWSRHDPEPDTVVDDFAFNPFKVEGGFGVVVARTADDLRVQSSYGIAPRVAASALRDAADLLDRRGIVRH